MSITKNISKKYNSFTDWLSGLWSSLFSSSSSTDNSLQKSRGSNAYENLTFPDTVNYDLAMDLYYNRKSGYKLGAFFCHAIISLPLTFMGVPHFDVEDWEKVNNQEFWEKRFRYYNEKMIMIKKEIQKLCHITGTVGVFPFFNTKSGNAELLIIKSKYISHIFIDPSTQEMTGLTTTINYSYQKEKNKIYYYKEITNYTKQRITITRTGHIPNGLRQQEIKRNPTGILPIMFTNDKEAREFEGHSEFERILSLIKCYSQINHRAHEEVLNIRAKLIQKVSNADKWMENNGFKNITEVNIDDKDVILNSEFEESRIEVPQKLIENHIQLLKIDYWAKVETTGIPEIWWGLKTEGNHASAAEQAMVGLAYVREKQVQATDPWEIVLEAMIFLEALAYNQTFPENTKIVWNELSMLTEIERAQIFDSWCSGIQKLIDSHSISLEGIHSMLLELTKEKITKDFDEFKKQIKEFGTLRAFLEQEYYDIKGDGKSEEDEEKTPEEIEPEPVTEKIQRNGVKNKDEKVI